MSSEDAFALLGLLQLAGASLPVGAFAYSEGLEALIASGRIQDAQGLQDWLTGSLRHGTARLEAAVMRRTLMLASEDDRPALTALNAWLSATKETEELRQQSHQMGRSLAQLLAKLSPEVIPLLDAIGPTPNFACAFGIGANAWGLAPDEAAIGFLQSWTTNAVTAGVKSIPLGQTAGQQLIRALGTEILACANAIATWPEDDWGVCGWGLGLASMAHETQYSRLYRS